VHAGRLVPPKVQGHSRGERTTEAIGKVILAAKASGHHAGGHPDAHRSESCGGSARTSSAIHAALGGNGLPSLAMVGGIFCMRRKRRAAANVRYPHHGGCSKSGRMP
jgi:hypothetical protein